MKVYVFHITDEEIGEVMTITRCEHDYMITCLGRWIMERGAIVRKASIEEFNAFEHDSEEHLVEDYATTITRLRAIDTAAHPLFA